MRLVLDTAVIVAALGSKSGASNRLLELAQDHRFTLIVSTALFLEYEAVLSRPEQRKRLQISLADIETFLLDLAKLAEPIAVHFQWRPQLRDAGDEMVLEAAMNGRADALVTHNVKDFAGISGSLKIRILNPGEALKEIQG